MIENIKCFRLLTPDLATAGQPAEDQLADVARAGFQAVVNLGLHESYYALPDEEATVTALGMDYSHIPVEWTAPRMEDLARFFEVMDALAGRRVFVHCAENKRVSGFVALWRVARLGWLLEKAMPDVRALWEPIPHWAAFMEEALPPTHAKLS